MRTCVVTGASSGIGQAIAEALVALGERVVLVCRDPARGGETARELRANHAGAEVELVVADLASIEGCKKAAREMAAVCPKLDVLIHNAGIWPTRLERNVDGFERSFAVNSVAPFMLNRLLMPSLAAAAPARIVQVSAGIYVRGKVDRERTPVGADFHRLRSYADTKLWNLMCTMEEARRREGSGITVNAVHPGVVRTRLGDLDGVGGVLLRAVKRFWATPEDGAVGPVRLAVAPEVAGDNGRYYDRLRPAELVGIARDAELATALWERTRELAKMG
jgi:NAD(P)-dependent dehydrogenase (short-subunit alcohol dehydrogenase family)